jgi:hypothetical protein
MFVPTGVPVVLLPFLVCIEIISHVAKLFSLAIRLFANMMSGHVLLHILTGFALSLAKQNLVLLFVPLLIIASIILLEIGICILQGYVFLTLLSIFFEEHFGYTKVDMILFLKIILINGKKVKLFFTNLLIKLFFFKRKSHLSSVFFYKKNKKNVSLLLLNIGK